MFSNRNIGQFVEIYIFFVPFSSPCRKDQFVVSYFSTPYSFLTWDTYISLRRLRFGQYHVTKPLFGIVIVWSYATENFPVQFSWKQFYAIIFKLMVNFEPGDTWETIFFISDTGCSEEKIRVEPIHRLDSCCENQDFLFQATCFMIKNSFSHSNYSAPKAKISVRSDPDFVDGRKKGQMNC